VLRYLERVMGYDLDAVRDAIIAETNGAYVVGARKVSKDGLTYTLDGHVVVTIDNAHSPKTSTIRGIAHSGRNGRPVADRRGRKGDRRRPLTDDDWREEVP
jgi:hypothetical protein